ncbi:epimerase family protein SDR39U1 [Polistes fuscatus]|uniref:epimerase family protein SDR39U1 n=1 Tax=Polistes fuscatus TaxID=30207 RepID=UPI001CAA1FFB|nr:epimerase family protein SDR39U1 [Polistes fuscatus]XP_043505295.1 epimerase family protein SDR39U1 [Polistes fuscatus]
MSLKHVVIGGGTGFIGKRLIDLLCQQGITCTIVSRQAGPNRISWKDVKENGLPKYTSAVINVAGQNVLDPTKRWSSEFKQVVIDSRVKTTETLARAVESTDAKAFVTISGVAYYKPNGTTYTEESECIPYDFLSELCRDWEAAAQLSKESKIRQVTIRSGVVLGKDGGMIKQIYLPFLLGLGGPIGTGNQYMPWIHITDLVNMFLFAMKNDNVHGILNGVAPEPVTNKEFTKAFASALRRPAIIPLPSFVLNVMFSEERAKMILEGQKVLPKRTEELGFQYQFPDINSACKEIVN